MRMLMYDPAITADRTARSTRRTEQLASLFELFNALFSPDELRTFLVLSFPPTVDLVRELPGPQASANSITLAAVELLDRNGLIDRDFFAALLRQRSWRKAAIEDTARIWNIPLDDKPTPPPPDEQSRERPHPTEIAGTAETPASSEGSAIPRTRRRLHMLLGLIVLVAVGVGLHNHVGSMRWTSGPDTGEASPAEPSPPRTLTPAPEPASTGSTPLPADPEPPRTSNPAPPTPRPAPSAVARPKAAPTGAQQRIRVIPGRSLDAGAHAELIAKLAGLLQAGGCSEGDYSLSVVPDASDLAGVSLTGKGRSPLDLGTTETASTAAGLLLRNPDAFLATLDRGTLDGWCTHAADTAQ